MNPPEMRYMVIAFDSDSAYIFFFLILQNIKYSIKIIIWFVAMQVEETSINIFFCNMLSHFSFEGL